MRVCVSVCVHIYMAGQLSEEATGLINSSPSGTVSQRSHRTMGLFLWCNWSIRQNKGRACCSACASSIMHKRCTDRILLVKHDTCKSPVPSLVWHCTVGVVMWPLWFQRPSDFVIIVSKSVLWGLIQQGAVLKLNFEDKEVHEMVQWISCWPDTVNGQTTQKNCVIENKALYGFTEKWVIPLWNTAVNDK